MTPAELKQIRTEAGETQKSFARGLKVSEIRVRKWENQSEFSERQQYNIKCRVKDWREKSGERTE